MHYGPWAIRIYTSLHPPSLHDHTISVLLSLLFTPTSTSIQHPPPRHKVIHPNVPPTNPPLSRESRPAMQHAPIVKDQRLPRHELDPNLEFRRLQDFRPHACRSVPQVHGLPVLPLRRRGAVVVVPPHLSQVVGVEVAILLDIRGG